jgi:biopolymer transport protein ExbD
MELRKGSKVQVEFNMASMTDIVFLLLIFFVVTSTVVKEPVLKILLPKGAKDNVIKQNIKLMVNKDLQYAIDENVVSFERLPEAMNAVLIQNPGATVSIYGDKSVNYEKVMDLVYLVNTLGGKPVLALEPVK